MSPPHRLSMTSLRREFTRQEKKVAEGHLAKVWSDLEVDLPAPLEQRFVDVKKRLVTRDKYEAVQASWDRLRAELKKRAIEIEAVGPDVRTTLTYIQYGIDLKLTAW